MDLAMFQELHPGRLVPISGTDPVHGQWQHHAFVPDPLPADEPTLTPPTYRAVADARAALATLNTMASRLPNPTLLRLPTLRREAQSTSALEGTYAPLAQVLTADDEDPPTAELTEILNYVHAANHGFGWISDGRPITTTFLNELQGLLMRGTPLESVSGSLRETQVVIGRRAEADPRSFPVHQARFVPPPEGSELGAGVAALVAWLREDHHGHIDPVVASAMSHYQFETLHPYRDGNGRIGRLLIVLTLVASSVLSEPTLTVSPWFEARRERYYDRLLAVSTSGDWDGWVRFFAQGLEEAATSTYAEMQALVDVRDELNQIIHDSTLRAGNAHALVDLAVANPSFTVRRVESGLGISYGRANKLVSQLVELGVLEVIDPDAYKRRFFAPRVLDVLVNRGRA